MCVCLFLRVGVFVCLCLCVCVSVSVFVCLCVCVCVGAWASAWATAWCAHAFVCACVYLGVFGCVRHTWAPLFYLQLTDVTNGRLELSWQSRRIISRQSEPDGVSPQDARGVKVVVRTFCGGAGVVHKLFVREAGLAVQPIHHVAAKPCS